jgi:type II secretory pathway component PulF
LESGRAPPAGGLPSIASKLKIPIAGKLLVQCAWPSQRAPLATLLAGGITLVESWEIAAESITNLELRRRSSAILPQIPRRTIIYRSLERQNGCLHLALDMIGIGERQAACARCWTKSPPSTTRGEVN